MVERKKIDSRIISLINNGIGQSHRSVFVVVGDRGRDQVVTLHYLLSKQMLQRPNVLWCYKKDLGFTTHRKKRMKQIKSQIARGIRDADQDDPFELFVSSTDVRYTYYKETEKILGNTYGMCVLQDFEAITPNILARTIETVQGGGIVVLLLKTMTSLKQLYTMNMDVHSRYRTETHHETIARFNERFILSLGNCDSCLVMDDELNILPISTGKNVKPISRKEDSELTGADKELADLKSSLQDTQPVGSLANCTKTVDQAKAVLTFVEAIADKTLRATVSLTAGRGRGKSAALGISIAAAVAYGYSNIFITSPSPENLKTLFEFIFKGFDALGYEEHLDYDVIQSTNPAFQKAIVRVNVFRDHRQTIQYIQPQDHYVLSQAELLVIDEAAAIPLPQVKKLLGPYLVFMASTINGYEGTGRSLSLKLLKQLREQTHSSSSGGGGGRDSTAIVNRDGSEAKPTSSTSSSSSSGGLSSRTLREIQLSTPIRYKAQDPIESWLNLLLCLDCCNPSSDSTTSKALPLYSGIPLTGSGKNGCPHPTACELFYVNRDTLFSFHPVSETFLQRMMSLYVASHYKNSPNDLQLMSDAPAHHLFVLLPPITEPKAGTPFTLPDPLVVIQVCLEGAISKQTALASLAKGVRHSGDLIPWVVSQQFQDDDFATLNGARVVRIATHPDYTGMGYGRRALEQLEQYYLGKFVGLDEDAGANDDASKFEVKRVKDEELEKIDLKSEKISVRDPSKMPPLLLRLSERPLPSTEQLHWLGVSYGLTQPLQKFWKRVGFSPVYMRQTANDITGEHTCIMLKALSATAAVPSNSDQTVVVGKQSWLSEFSWDFSRRFIELLAYQFRKFSPILVLSIMEAAQSPSNILSNKRIEAAPIDSKSQVSRFFTPFDLKRLESYTNNLLDYHVIMDMAPTLARQYFLGQLEPSSTTSSIKPVHMSPVQAAILCGVGLQKKTIDDLEKELDLPGAQIMALFGKVVKKCALYLNEVVTLDTRDEIAVKPVAKPTSFEEKKKKEQSSSSSDDDSNNSNNMRRDPMDEESWDPTKESLDDVLEEAGNEEIQKIKTRQKELINSWDLSRYTIGGNDEDWSKAQMGSKSGIINIPAGVDDGNTKKRKTTSGVAAELAEKSRSDKNGIYDPKNLLGSKKKGGKKRKTAS